jgi:Phage regulatory protein Rha (Phage_pRha)
MNLVNTIVTMTSREIAELTEKEHSHVLRDIRSMFEALGVDQSSFGRVYLGGNGQERPMFCLPYDETICLLTGYDVKARMKVIKRWQELEQNVIQPQPVTQLPVLTPFQKIEFVRDAGALVNDEELKATFPLIWQSLVDGVQNDIVAMFGNTNKLITSEVSTLLDIMEIAKRNELLIPQNLKGVIGKYVKSNSSIPPTQVERVINGGVRKSFVYTNHKEVATLIKIKLDTLSML